MDIAKSLKIEFLVIVGMLFFGAILGYQECLNFWKMDLGSCIATIGVIWGIASFFRIYGSISSNLASLVTAIMIFIIGFGISEYGFFTALVIAGFAGLYIASMGRALYPAMSNIVFIVAIIIIPLGLILRPFDKPTNPKKYYQPITYSDIKWGAFVYYYDQHGKQTGTNIAYIVGNEESAYKKTHEMVKQWKSEHPSYKIAEVQVRIPDSLYSEAYNNGYCPTHILFSKYTEKFAPSWANFKYLEN